MLTSGHVAYSDVCVHLSRQPSILPVAMHHYSAPLTTFTTSLPASTSKQFVLFVAQLQTCLFKAVWVGRQAPHCSCCSYGRASATNTGPCRECVLLLRLLW